jgi:hypothetical protein
MSQKEWTIMIYMAGDNNLAVDMAYAMQQIKEVAGQSPDSPNIFVYYDGNSPSIPTLYCDFSDPIHPRYVSSRNVEDKLEKVPDKYNENAADDKSLLNFVDWCLNKVEVRDGDNVTRGRRANRYALIFSGHSLGFQDIGLFKDESTGKSMKMEDLYHALQRLISTEAQLKKDVKGLDLEPEDRKRDTTVLIGQELDILGFDSCVMGMLEVGYQFGYVAKTMIASEGSLPSAGWTYAKLLGSLATGTSGEKVAERFVRAFIEGQDAYTIGGVSVDIAAWDLKKLTDLANAFDDLAWTLNDCFADPGSVIYRQMSRVILQVHWMAQSYMYDQNVDLGDFCELLGEECARVAEELGDDQGGLLTDLQDRCHKVLDELRNAVILSGFSGGGYQYSNGISVFFPWSRVGYEASKKNYESLFFSKDTKNKSLYWTGFLRKYLSDVSLRRSAEPTTDVSPGAKYRYISGVPFDNVFAMNGSAVAASKIAGQESSKIAGQEFSKIAGHESSKIAGQQASKIAGQESSKIAGQEFSKIAGHESSKIAGQESSKIAGQESSKIAGHESSKIAGQESSKIAGQESSKIAGQESSKIAGQESSKIAGQESSKIAGQESSKIAGHESSKIAGHESSKIAGHESSKIAGHESSKIAGQESSKIAGHESSKIAGQESSKIAGHESSKIAGHESSKIAGHESSKIAGHESSKLAGGGSSAFFDSLKLFKNIESKWNISGFTKKAEHGEEV